MLSRLRILKLAFPVVAISTVQIMSKCGPCGEIKIQIFVLLKNTNTRYL